MTSTTDDDSPSTDLPPSTPRSPSILTALTYPVSYTVSGLIRRISADDAPTPLARALSANYNGSMMSTYQPPPKRRNSPFQPPPLTPLSLSGWRESTPHSSRLLNKALAEEIRLLLPPRLQLVDNWALTYSLEQNGTSLASLYGLVDHLRGKRGGFVLVVRDADGSVRPPLPCPCLANSAQLFGAYLSDAPHPSPHYFGTGECFLWRCVRLPDTPDLSSLPPPPSEDTTHLGRMTTVSLSRGSSDASLASLPRRTSALRNEVTRTPSPATVPRRSSAPVRFKAFPYTGENDFTILCGAGYLSVGGGDGRYGLWLDDRMARGVSEGCPTFDNEPLSEVGNKFDILGVELWYIGA